MRRLKRAKTTQELRSLFGEIGSTCSGDTRFMAQANMFMAEQIVGVREELSRLRDEMKALRKRQSKKRPLSPWQQFAAEGLRAGKSMQQIGKEWREKTE